MQENELSESFELLSDEELVGLYNDGVQDAFGELSVRYIFVIRNKSADLYHMGVEAEDLFQEGLIALHTAVKNYRNDGGAAFRTYAAVCIRNHLVSVVRLANNSHNKINNNAISLDTQLSEHAVVSDPENELAAEEKLQEVIDRAEKYLSVMERKVLELYIDGNTYEEISSALGISVKSCDNAMQRVRRKLKQLKI